MDEATIQQVTAEDEIRALIDDSAKAARAKDIDAIMSCYAPDIRSFDAITALQFKGTEAYRKHWETCLSFMQGPMKFDIHDLDIAAQDEVAFCHYLVHCGATGPDGKEHGGWLRATVCFRKIDGKWLIVHEHLSSPFDPESGKVLDLQP